MNLKKSVRFVCITVMLLLVICMFDGCMDKSANLSKKNSTTIAIIYDDMNKQDFEGQEKAAQKKARAMGAEKVIKIDAKSDADKYEMALDSVISKKVKGIVVSVSDLRLAKEAVNKCSAANIPLITCNYDIRDEKKNMIAPFVGSDSMQEGRDVSEWLLNYADKNNFFKDKSSTGVLFLYVNSNECNQVTDGQTEILNKKMPDFPKEQIFKAEYNGQISSSFDAAAALMTAHLNINKWLVMACSDEGAEGAARVLEQIKLDKNSAVVGVGANLIKNELKNRDSCFKASAYIDKTDIGKIFSEEIMNFIKKKTPIPEDYRVKDVIVTKENYEKVIGEE